MKRMRDEKRGGAGSAETSAASEEVKKDVTLAPAVLKPHKSDNSDTNMVNEEIEKKGLKDSAEFQVSKKEDGPKKLQRTSSVKRWQELKSKMDTMRENSPDTVAKP